MPTPGYIFERTVRTLPVPGVDRRLAIAGESRVSPVIPADRTYPVPP